MLIFSNNLFNKYKRRLFNILIRVSTMLTRFVFLFILAKIVDIELVASYGLILASVSFFVMLIGADFYIYAQREMLQINKTEWYWVLMQQLYGQLGLYLIFLPFGLLLFFFGVLPWNLVILFFILLTVEHISQEINRILVGMDKQIVASIILFVRKALWMFPVLAFIYFDSSFANIDFIISAWILGCFVSILIGVKNIKSNIIMGTFPSLDFLWIKKGLKSAGIFLVATLCLKALTTFDQYAIEMLGNKELLAVYIVYMTVVFGTFSFLEPAVYSFLYPTIVSSYHHNNQYEFNKAFKELIYSTIIIGFILAVFIFSFTPTLLQWINKEQYIEHLDILYILVVAGFVSNLEYIPHYYLYAAKADMWIVYPKIVSFLIFCINIYLSKNENILETVSYGLLGAYLSILLLQTLGYFQIKYKGKI